MIYFETIFVVILFIWKAEGKDCIARDFDYGSIVCVCNSTYCDSIPDVEEPEKGKFHWYVSSKDGLRLSFSQGKFADEFFHEHHESFEFNENFVEDFIYSNAVKLTVNRTKTYQPIYGFGGSFTDSAGINILSLSKEARELLMQSYFGKEGSRYNFGRLPLGSSDFSVRFYTYDDVENDSSLKHFQLAKEDIDIKIPLMRWAQELSPYIKFIAATWSPPVWMKTNNNTDGPSVLKKEYFGAFANYIMKSVAEYKNHGVKIWAVSTGNEPTNAFAPNFHVPSMGWPAFALGDWVANDLGPAIVNSEYNETYILVFDDQRYLLTWYADMVFSNREALNLINGIAVHWYLDSMISPDVLDSMNEKHPNKFLLMTEACIGFRVNDQPKVRLGYWEGAEEYVLDIIENLRHWVTGWIDWNLALDETGGPNWVNNFVDAPIIIDSKSDEFFKQPVYYMITHFSRFVDRDSKRIYSSETDEVKSVAFETPSKTVVVILYNWSLKDNNVEIYDSKSGTIKVNLAPQSIHTIVYK